MGMELLTYTEASARVQDEAARLAPSPSESLPLREAQGRVLATPVSADRDQPPFPRATRDGFAARAAFWARGPLQVAGLLRAGEAWCGGELAEEAAIEIMTGAPVPPGTDCVVMVEHTERAGDEVSLRSGRGIAPGDNIVPRGAEARAGSVLLSRGTRLTAHGIAVAAACGYSAVEVFRKPRVAILATGDELVDVAEMPREHQIRNSNTYTLAAQAQALGGEPILLPPVADIMAALRDAIAGVVDGCDLLLLSGGVSMGKYDLVEPALADLDAQFHFTGVQIQPGKPVVFGSLKGGALPFFGLPGNPVSTIICFALFAAPVLAALGGETGYTPPFVQATLAAALPNKPGLTRFLPARLTHSIDGSRVETILWQGSGDLAGTARANCFLVVPPDAANLQAGATVSVLLA